MNKGYQRRLFMIHLYNKSLEDLMSQGIIYILTHALKFGTFMN